MAPSIGAPKISFTSPTLQSLCEKIPISLPPRHLFIDSVSTSSQTLKFSVHRCPFSPCRRISVQAEADDGAEPCHFDFDLFTIGAGSGAMNYGISVADSFVKGGDQPPRGRDVELGNWVPNNNSELGMEALFKQVREVERQMEKLLMLLQKLQEANEESKSVTKASAMKAIKRRMEKDMDEVGKVVQNIKAKLEEIDRDNLNNRQMPGCGKGTGVDRSRMAMTNALKKKLKDRMTDFQVLRQTIQNEYREVVERRVFTVTGTRPDEKTIDDLIETGKSEQIFSKAIQEMGRAQILDTVEEIQERYDAVKEIEKRLLDLHQVFMDMAVLVEAQGDLLDNIETQVTNAVDHVQSGTDALKTAKSLQQKSRKCMLITIIILLIVAIIVVLSILKPWKK